MAEGDALGPCLREDAGEPLGEGRVRPGVGPEGEEAAGLEVRREGLEALRPVEASSVIVSVKFRIDVATQI